MSELSREPRRVEWSGPEGWTVWADEDGVHLRSARGDALEQPDVLALIALYQTVRSQVCERSIPAPRPPTREEAARWHELHQRERVAREAARAVAKVINPSDVAF